MKVIIDTNVYFSAFGFGGITDECVEHCFLKYDIEVFISVNIFTEVSSKLNSAKFKTLSKYRRSESDIDVFLNRLEKICISIEPTNKVDISRDPKDNMLLELALEIEADYIITGDEDLLILKSFRGTQILKPSQFLARFKLLAVTPKV
jgi:putative PIN family toxin of toxin-antitoxin system